ncbi:MAG: potassium/proton antiporter, partial [Bacteroidota bacterium]
SLEQMIVISSLLLFIGVLASKISVKLGVPALLFFLIIGALVSGWNVEVIAFFKNPHIAQRIGILTLVLVLFLGGLETDFNHVRPVLRSSIMLSTFGALINTAVVSIFVRWITKGYLGLTECFLLGTIVSSTDAAAVFSILGTRDMKLKANIEPVIESESGSNDVVINSSLLFLLKLFKYPDTSLYSVIPYFFQEIFIGALGGVLLGYFMWFVINKINLTYPGLYLALVLSMIFLGYAVINSLHGSGFLGVYMAAIVLSQKDFIQKKSLLKTLKGLSWLMQIGMFITFGLLVIPGRLMEVSYWGIQLSFVLIFIARPIAVFASLAYSSFKFKHKLFISWVGLRGAVPLIFATYLYSLDHPQANTLFHLVFFVVLVSISLQGTTLYPLANWLRLEDVRQQKHKSISESADEVKKMLIELVVPVGSIVHDKPIVELNFPKNALIALIHRDKRYFTAHGQTVIKANDRLLIMINAKKDLGAIKESLGI